MKLFLIVFLTTAVCFELTALKKYEVECHPVLLEVSLDSALSQAGVVEKTNRNDGAVSKYLISAGVKTGSPYCAAGVYWCFYAAADALEMDESKIPVKRTAAANEMFNDAAKRGKKAEYKAEKHDLLIWRKRASWQGHIERIFETGKAGWVKTIAFNVRKDLSSPVEGVFIKKRCIFHPLGRLRIRGLIGFETRSER